MGDNKICKREVATTLLSLLDSIKILDNEIIDQGQGHLFNNGETMSEIFFRKTKGLLDLNDTLDFTHLSPVKYTPKFTYDTCNDPSEKVIIMLHGYGSYEGDLLTMGRRFPEYMCVSLRAPFDVNSMPRGYSWSTISYNPKSYNMQEFERSKKYILQFTEYVKAEYGAKEIVLLGFSQGAVMAHAVGLSNPNLYKALIALSGYVHESTNVSKQAKDLNVFIAHGSQDLTVPIDQDILSHGKLSELKYHWKVYEQLGHNVSSQELKDIAEWLKTM